LPVETERLVLLLLEESLDVDHQVQIVRIAFQGVIWTPESSAIRFP
jgi:hypothetical protein